MTEEAPKKPAKKATAKPAAEKAAPKPRATKAKAEPALDKVEKLLWGSTVQGEYEMTIATPRWQRTLGLRLWMDRPRRSFVRIVSPAKEAGIGSLRIGTEMWNYLPNVERIVKIATDPGDIVLDCFVGSGTTAAVAHKLGRRWVACDPLISMSVLCPIEMSHVM